MARGESMREGCACSWLLVSEDFEGSLIWGAFQRHAVHIFGCTRFSDTKRMLWDFFNEDEYLHSQGMYGHDLYIPSKYYSY